MIKLDNLIQLKAFARQDGALLSLLWTASFAAVIYAPQTPLGNILALATPFFIGWRLASFRNYALNGVISFRRGFAYSVFTLLLTFERQFDISIFTELFVLHPSRKKGIALPTVTFIAPV